jgi:hypothetical protein
MIGADHRDHIVWVDRDTAGRMLCAARSRENFSENAARSRQIHSFAEYLRQSLMIRGTKIQLKGSLGWFRDLVQSCGDAQAALEIGMGLESDD